MTASLSTLLRAGRGLCLAAAFIAVIVLGPASLTTAATADTEDVIYLMDGREIHGEIVSETETTVVIQIVTTGIRGSMTIAREDIARIDQDVEIVEESPTRTPTRRPANGSTSRPETVAGTSDSLRSRFGVGRGASSDEALPAIYIVPMRGQMGTDIHLDIYEEVAEDIRAWNPDVLVFELNCDPRQEIIVLGDPDAPTPEEALIDFEQYRRIIDLFKDDLPGIRQVMWVHDSVGISSAFALAWEELYMHPEAELTGLKKIWEVSSGWDDPDVRAKMVAAWVGIANGLIENGNYPLELGRAMMEPKHSLSATWRGREVRWTLDENGEYIVDSNDEATSTFTAKTAEDFCISDGTAESIDDLALLLGYREYRVIEGDGTALCESYVEDWRRLFDQTKVWWRDYQTAGDGAENEIAALGAAKSAIEKIIRAMNRYEAIELRWQTDMGIRKFDLEILVEQIREQLRQLRDNGRGGGGGRGIGGGGGGGIGGG